MLYGEEFFEIIIPLLKSKISGLRHGVVEPFAFLWYFRE